MSARNAEAGFSPLDRQWGLNASVYSLEMAQQMVWLSALLPYEQCASVFERIAGRLIPASSIWRQTELHGERMEAYVARQRDQVSMERVVLPDASHDHDQPKAITLDGGMVNIRGEGWRELKVGAVFDVERRLERNPQTRELEPMAHGVNVHYTAVLGSRGDFTPALWALALEQALPTARHRAVIGDGAAWIWNVAEEVSPQALQIVDWFHAVQHLADAALALYPEDSDERKRQRWLKTYQNHLYLGSIHKIIAVLHRQGRADLAGYFETHQRRMQYLAFREQGFPIGSGTVESGVKQFKQRLTGSGRRWKPDQANRMITLRAAVLSDDFDSLWRAA
jgi:hypothetical protein